MDNNSIIILIKIIITTTIIIIIIIIMIIIIIINLYFYILIVKKVGILVGDGALELLGEEKREHIINGLRYKLEDDITGSSLHTEI